MSACLAGVWGKVDYGVVGEDEVREVIGKADQRDEKYALTVTLVI